MNTPPLLLGLTLLFWGWRTGYLAMGAILGALIELPRLARARWTFSQSDLDRLWNLCALIFVGAAVYLFLSEGTLSLNDFLTDTGRRPDLIREKGRAALLWFQWFPMLLYPFVIAVAWSEEPRVDVTTFSWFLRRRRQSRDAGAETHVNVAYPFFALILFSTCATNERDAWFYPCFCVLLAWALWSQRTHRYPALFWIALFVVVSAGGHFSHRGVAGLERAIEEMNVAWFPRFSTLTVDAKQIRTVLGSIGRLKLSDRIIYRVRTDGQPPPPLLREASYATYRAPLWVNTRREFIRELSEATNSSTWLLLPQNQPRGRVNIAAYLFRGRGILPAPGGISRFDHLPVEELEHNPLGVVRVQGGPGLVMYDASYGDDESIDAPPTDDDRRVLDTDEPAVDQVARQIGLTNGMPALKALALVQGFFAKNFTYSTYLTIGNLATNNETALSRFLLKERTGHCEYFATASTLLLRKAGLPARYAIGYAVEEGSGRKYVVRERHAHAWTLYYDQGEWRDFDATPASWNALEARSSWLRPFRDLYSNLWFQFSKWRWSNTQWRHFIVWLPVPLVLAALGAFFLKKQWRRTLRGPGAASGLRRAGRDSEFYAIQRQLARRGLDRWPAETMGSWLARIDAEVSQPAALRQLVALHMKYRFDPNGLTAGERAMLARHANVYLRELRHARR